MSTFDNAPPPDGWTPTARACPLPDCDVCGPRDPQGFGVYPLPAGVELGEN